MTEALIPAPSQISLTRDEVRRYSRHLIIPDIGVNGQQRLKDARVLCIGAGGLGSPALLYLAAAGVGTIGIIDGDHVDESNLQRQIIHGTSDVGRPKVESAAEAVAEINPHVRVTQYREMLTHDNALEIFGDHDLIVDGTDNFTTRYLINDAAVLAGKPYVWGSIYRFNGQTSVFWPGRGPCYRCLHPAPPPPGLVPSCAEGGVLGAICATIASIQVTEVLKLLTGVGTPLVGRLLMYEALDATYHQIRIAKNPDCAICGDAPTITELVDDSVSCASTQSVDPELVISCDELRTKQQSDQNFLLVDVREPAEFELGAVYSGCWINNQNRETRVGEDSLEDLEQRRARLYDQLAATGDFRRGSISENYRRCGKPNCVCAQEGHPGHGPRYLWTRTVAGRGTKGRQLSVEEVDKVRAELANYHRFAQVSEQIVAVNEAICEARPPNPAATAPPAGTTGHKKGGSATRSRRSSPPR